MESLRILHKNLCSCHLGKSPCLAPALLSLLWAQGLQSEASGLSYSQASNIPRMKSLSSHPSGKCYRGKIRHQANNKCWKQDCFRAGWELKSSGQIKSLTKIHLSCEPFCRSAGTPALGILHLLSTLPAVFHFMFTGNALEHQPPGFQ